MYIIYIYISVSLSLSLAFCVPICARFTLFPRRLQAMAIGFLATDAGQASGSPLRSLPASARLVHPEVGSAALCPGEPEVFRANSPGPALGGAQRPKIYDELGRPQLGSGFAAVLQCVANVAASYLLSYLLAGPGMETAFCGVPLQGRPSGQVLEHHIELAIWSGFIQNGM